MESKVCFKCGVLKPLSDFYKHAEMKDGHLNKCKTCTKRDVSQHRCENIEKVRGYDRNRPNKVERNRDGVLRTKQYRLENPLKYAAHVLFNNAIRDGFVERQYVCEKCNSNKHIVAHHPDYKKPLVVMWLCEVCHKAWHKDHGEGLT